MPDEFAPKIVQLPGTLPSPEVILHRTLTKLPHIRNVVVLIQWDDGSWAADWSAMTKAEFAFAERYLDKRVNGEIFGEK